MAHQQHPIQLPHELVHEWEDEYHGHMPEWVLRHVATEAAQWGADQELEACLGEVSFLNSRALADRVRAARRPKPPSLKEEGSDSKITLSERGEEVIRVDREGFHYKGQFIADAGEAHRLLVAFLKTTTRGGAA